MQNTVVFFVELWYIIMTYGKVYEDGFRRSPKS